MERFEDLRPSRNPMSEVNLRDISYQGKHDISCSISWFPVDVRLNQSPLSDRIIPIFIADKVPTAYRCGYCNTFAVTCSTPLRLVLKLGFPHGYFCQPFNIKRAIEYKPVCTMVKLYWINMD